MWANGDVSAICGPLVVPILLEYGNITYTSIHELRDVYELANLSEIFADRLVNHNNCVCVVKIGERLLVTIKKKRDKEFITNNNSISLAISRQIINKSFKLNRNTAT